MVEITSEEKNKVKKRMKRTEDSLRDLWDNIKRTNIRIIGVPEEDVQSLSHVQFFATQWTAAGQASLSFTIS